MPRPIHKTALFVPCYNVEAEVVGVLEGITPAILERVSYVLLFDNQSQDRTRDTLKQYLKERNDSKFKLFENAANYSLGGSTMLGFQKALELQQDYLIVLHSDGQADPADLVPLLDAIDEEGLDLVFGSRFLPSSKTAHYSLTRKLGNLFFIYLQWIILGAKVRDLGSMIGYRLALVKSLPYQKLGSGMSYHPYLVLTAFQLAKQKIRWKEFPISWGKVVGNNVNPWVYGFHYLRQLLRFYFHGPQIGVDRLLEMKTVEWKKNSR